MCDRTPSGRPMGVPPGKVEHGWASTSTTSAAAWPPRRVVGLTGRSDVQASRAAPVRAQTTNNDARSPDAPRFDAWREPGPHTPAGWSTSSRAWRITCLSDTSCVALSQPMSCSVDVVVKYAIVAGAEGQAGEECQAAVRNHDGATQVSLADAFIELTLRPGHID